MEMEWKAIVGSHMVGVMTEVMGLRGCDGGGGALVGLAGSTFSDGSGRVLVLAYVYGESMVLVMIQRGGGGEKEEEGENRRRENRVGMRRERGGERCPKTTSRPHP